MNTSESTIADFSDSTALVSRKTYPLLIFRYTLTYSLAFALGMVIWYALGFEAGDAVDEAVRARFSGVFSNCSSISECFEVLLRCSSSDINHIMLAFAAGFTMLANAALTCLLLFRGISLGFATAYLLTLIRSGMSEISSLRLGVYLSLSALIAASVICFCARSAIFSDDFRRMGTRRRLILRSAFFWRQIYAFLLTLGFSVLLGLLNCIG